MRPSFRLLTALPAAALLAGCFATSPRRVAYEPEEFDSTTTHTRSYGATEAQTCEAARRALLSQGYMITAADADLVTGRKSFQPAAEVHVEVELRAVCAREAARGDKRSTIAFVTALQDRFSLKKTNNSASLGVGAIGSLSLPFSSRDDAMVKVASETLTDERFYERFFALLERFLVAPAEEPPPVAPPAVAPLAAPPPALPHRAAPPSVTPSPVVTPPIELLPALPPPAAPSPALQPSAAPPPAASPPALPHGAAPPSVAPSPVATPPVEPPPAAPSPAAPPALTSPVPSSPERG